VALSAKSRKIVRYTAVILSGLALAVFLVLVPWFFTWGVTEHRHHFPDPNDGKTPSSFGMKFHDIEFDSTDGILLRGWYVPAGGRAQGTIVYCHGMNRTRVEMLPMAQFGHELGYNGLLFDFRHAGSSGGAISTLGYQERHDVAGAVDYALGREHAARPLVVWGVSLGAASALLAAADSPQVAAVISDSSFLSLDEVIKHHWKLFFGLPAFPIADEIIYGVAWRGGFRPSDFDLQKAVERLGGRPVLFIAVAGDRRMPPAIARRLYDDARSSLKELVVVPGHRHGEGFKSGHEQYERAVTNFLASLASRGSAN
jgi:fermentation-respiration switch protein FrsA (DUF1100 family)